MVSHPLQGGFNDPAGLFLKTPGMAPPDSVVGQRISCAKVEMRVCLLEQNGIVVAADGLPTNQDDFFLQGNPRFATVQNQLDILLESGANDSAADSF